MNRQIRNVRAVVWALLAALVAGHGTQVWSQASGSAPGAPAAARACTALTQQSGAALGEPTAHILMAKLNPRSESKADPAAPPWMGPLPPMPEH